MGRAAAGGRPLRFLVVLLGGWAAARAVMLWPSVDGLALVTPAIASEVGKGRLAEKAAAVPVARFSPAVAVIRPRQRDVAPMPERNGNVPTATLLHERPEEPDAPTLPPPLPPTPIASSQSRLSGSAWAILRGGARTGLVGGQLGASQAGMRIAYALGDSRRLALTARLATPMAGKGSEAAVGVEWRLPDLPVRFIAEQRISLDGGRGGPTVGVVGGIGPRRIGRGLQVEAYGQAGMIARDGLERFADGAARLSRVAVRRGRLRLDLGIGAWGGAQRGAARLDVGPSTALSLPVGDRTIRMTLDWRQRIAGGARPGSGPALSIGGDF